MSGAEIVTFGCRVNAFESEAMRANIGACGGPPGGLVVVNTCAVTAEAERQARQAIRRARRDRPGARIVVTGCAAQIDPARYAAMPEVDRVIGNREKLAPDAFAPDTPARAVPSPVAVGDIMAAPEADAGADGVDGAPAALAGFADRARAFLQAQTGCDHRCTFCVIPYGRGNSRSVAPEALAVQARALAARGVREIVLCGVDIASWGADLPAPAGLAAMVRGLLDAVPELERLRLSSLDPAAVDAPLVALFAAEPRLMPHVHLSVQSGADMVLKRMKRRHRRADVAALCAALRAARPDMAIGADLIAGFPTETDAMHADTCALIRECEIALAHVFPYSERAGTPAARMPPVPKPVRKARAAELRAIGAEARARVLARGVGARAAVLMETAREGRTEHFLRARLAAPREPGAVVAARLVGHDGERWYAEAA